jgi:XTP/dITP diphosphohydrolase
MRRLVLASSNPGKLREFRQMLSPLGIEVVPQSELGISDAGEPHGTFIENALAKARHACKLSGLASFADDSGICVDALDGEPGVRSARYADAGQAGRDEQDRRNNEKLVAALQGRKDRGAHYYCVIVLVRRPEDPQPLIAEGRWRGEVIATRRGTGGFGYDSHFLLPALGRTAAELEPDEKNAISHRGQALARMVEMLRYAEYQAS